MRTLVSLLAVVIVVVGVVAIVMMVRADRRQNLDETDVIQMPMIPTEQPVTAPQVNVTPPPQINVTTPPPDNSGVQESVNHMSTRMDQMERNMDNHMQSVQNSVNANRSQPANTGGAAATQSSQSQPQTPPQ